eukprot:CAMPEP_0172520444 /NCGR_PEP_ID=MMETSP1066-20121228/292006_1 /TAXON_ID=671091 /ORGANISM="Coscinodiscus wailesii, Strain CCMP2513" /LENGTH=75 /DNA_ID=CAMNT_0013303201 /DNA_START=36 /DNA_END=264 /DNA_ORIENTATION=+
MNAPNQASVPTSPSDDDFNTWVDNMSVSSENSDNESPKPITNKWSESSDNKSLFINRQMDQSDSDSESESAEYEK